MTIQALYDQWKDFCRSVFIRNVSDSWKEITRQHEIPKRYYHTFFGHIAFCLQEFDNGGWQQLCENPNTVLAAIYTHDVICNSRSKTNEHDSAIWGEAFFKKYGALINYKKYPLIVMGTAGHKPTDDPDLQAMFDCDLASLGLSW
ncbi:hypothetical protein L0Y49_05095, partial [bacterium]|nr:hypothetical protein [bacterium]